LPQRDAQQQRPHRRRLAVAVALLALLLPVPAPAAEADAADKEAAVRAAFLYRLAFFVTWDAAAFAAADSPIRFCVASDRPSRVAELLRGQAGNRKVNERGIAVEQRSSAAGLEGCHLVYREGEAAGVATAAATQLVVVDSLAALARGGTLALVPERGPGGELRLGFVSRRDRLPSSGVTLSAKLLQLVRFTDGSGGA
jgi:hypothetical protein